jgi:hypothetical protein
MAVNMNAQPVHLCFAAARQAGGISSQKLKHRLHPGSVCFRAMI